MEDSDEESLVVDENPKSRRKKADTQPIKLKLSSMLIFLLNSLSDKEWVLFSISKYAIYIIASWAQLFKASLA